MGQAVAVARRVRFAQGVAAGQTQRAAALAAGYKDGPHLDSFASKLMKRPEVLAELERVERAGRASAVGKRRRALELLTQQLEFDLGPYIRECKVPVCGPAGVIMVDGAPLMTTRYEIDIEGIKKDGKSHLLAGVEFTDKGTIKLKLHDKQGAIDRLARLKGWNKPDRAEVNHTGEGLAQYPADFLEWLGKQHKRKA